MKKILTQIKEWFFPDSLKRWQGKKVLIIDVINLAKAAESLSNTAVREHVTREILQHL